MTKSGGNIEVIKISPDMHLPSQAYSGDLGLDICSDEDFTLEKGEVHEFRTGLRISLPPGMGALLKERYSMGRRGVVVCGGVMDSGYQGELRVTLFNGRADALAVARGASIAQLIPIESLADDLAVNEVSEFSRSTERGIRGGGTSDGNRPKVTAAGDASGEPSGGQTGNAGGGKASPAGTGGGGAAPTALKSSFDSSTG